MNKKNILPDILSMVVMCGSCFALGVLCYWGKPASSHFLPRGIYRVQSGHIWDKGRCYDLPKAIEIKQRVWLCNILGEEPPRASVTPKKQVDKVFDRAKDFAIKQEMGLPYDNEIIVKDKGSYYFVGIGSPSGDPLPSSSIPTGVYLLSKDRGKYIIADRIYKSPMRYKDRYLFMGRHQNNISVCDASQSNKIRPGSSPLDEADKLAIKYVRRNGAATDKLFSRSILVKTSSGGLYRYVLITGLG